MEKLCFIFLIFRSADAIRMGTDWQHETLRHDTKQTSQRSSPPSAIDPGNYEKLAADNFATLTDLLDGAGEKVSCEHHLDCGYEEKLICESQTGEESGGKTCHWESCGSGFAYLRGRCFALKPVFYKCGTNAALGEKICDSYNDVLYCKCLGACSCSCPDYLGGQYCWLYQYCVENLAGTAAGAPEEADRLCRVEDLNDWPCRLDEHCKEYSGGIGIDGSICINPEHEVGVCGCPAGTRFCKNHVLCADETQIAGDKYTVNKLHYQQPGSPFPTPWAPKLGTVLQCEWGPGGDAVDEDGGPSGDAGGGPIYTGGPVYATGGAGTVVHVHIYTGKGGGKRQQVEKYWKNWMTWQSNKPSDGDGD